MIVQKVLDLVCTQLSQIAYISIATRRYLTDQDITELILASDSDTHSLEDEDISAQRNSDTGGILTQMSHSELTVQTVDLLRYNRGTRHE
jgi:hypothetical protein